MNNITKHIPGLDAVRGIAIILVMLGHYSLEFLKMPPPFLQLMMGIANGGVIIFFILSGYLINQSIQKTKPITFLINRLFKIFPAYVVSVLLYILISICFQNEEINLRKIIGNILLSQDLLKVNYYNNVYWSLLIEIKFYFLIAIIYILNAKKVNSYIPYMLIIFNVCLYYFFNRSSSLLIWLPVFFIGMELFSLKKNNYCATAIYKTLFIIFASALNIGFFYEYGNVIAVVFLFIGSFLILFSFLIIRVPRPIIFLATISYSLYLYHTGIGYPIGNFVYSYTENKFIAILVASLLSIIISTISYRLIEFKSVKFGYKINNRISK